MSESQQDNSPLGMLKAEVQGLDRCVSELVAEFLIGDLQGEDERDRTKMAMLILSAKRLRDVTKRLEEASEHGT